MADFGRTLHSHLPHTTVPHHWTLGLHTHTHTPGPHVYPPTGLTTGRGTPPHYSTLDYTIRIHTHFGICVPHLPHRGCTPTHYSGYTHTCTLGPPAHTLRGFLGRVLGSYHYLLRLPVGHLLTLLHLQTITFPIYLHLHSHTDFLTHTRGPLYYSCNHTHYHTDSHTHTHEPPTTFPHTAATRPADSSSPHSHTGRWTDVLDRLSSCTDTLFRQPTLHNPPPHLRFLHTSGSPCRPPPPFPTVGSWTWDSGLHTPTHTVASRTAPFPGHGPTRVPTHGPHTPPPDMDGQDSSQGPHHTPPTLVGTTHTRLHIPSPQATTGPLPHSTHVPTPYRHVPFTHCPGYTLHSCTHIPRRTTFGWFGQPWFRHYSWTTDITHTLPHTLPHTQDHLFPHRHTHMLTHGQTHTDTHPTPLVPHPTPHGLFTTFPQHSCTHTDLLRSSIP